MKVPFPLHPFSESCMPGAAAVTPGAYNKHHDHGVARDDSTKLSRIVAKSTKRP